MFAAGVPNTTQSTQETDINYGPFKSSFRINLEVITQARINDEKPVSFAPYMVALFVFGGTDHVTKAVAPRNAFQDGFSREWCLKAWAKVGAAPITRACLSDPKVRRELGDSEDDLGQKMRLIQDLNDRAVAGLNARGWNGSAFAGKIKERRAVLTRPISQPNTRARQEDIAAATSTGARYHATGGGHITSDDMFKSIEVGKRNAEAAQLEKEKKSRLEKMELEEECHGILYQLAEDGKDPNGKQLKRLLRWQEKKSTRVAEDLLVWNAICAEHEAIGTTDEIISALPSVKRWTLAEEERLIWLKTAEVDTWV